MKDKKSSKMIGMIVLAGVIVLGVFLALNRRPDDSVFTKDNKTNTEAQNILAKDIDRNYPATVREVVRLFSRISKCYYNEEISEKEFKELAAMQQKLFDEEFLEINPLEDFTNELYAEIQVAKKNKESMVVYAVQKQSSVNTWNDGENNFSSIIASFTMTGETYTKTYEEFLLREDADGRWKIVGWRLTDPVEIVD